RIEYQTQKGANFKLLLQLFPWDVKTGSETGMISVLIVDDDTFLHKVLDRILVIGGYEIVGHAYDGAEAITIYTNLNPKPDITLMDHRMPVMSGTVATREIMHINREARILFISADETVKKEAMESGALAFLTKPIRSVDLFAAIESSIKKNVV
ncbi:MAG: response regulator, partial [Candidatus Thorarchaeota archaeon]|nr:response regulator [Candidatus Thorarchaeota archaeon]